MNVRSQFFDKAGFSLIELLVVVAIIGVLAAVGLLSYNGFITSTKDEAGKANAVQLASMMNTDHIAITSGVSGRSSINADINADSLCRTQADKIVFELNATQNKKNSHNESCPYAFNGNRAWSSVNNLDNVNNVNYFTGCPVAVTANTIKVPRGRLMVACVSNAASIGSSAYKLYTCHCGGEAECETTNVGDDCGTSPFLGYGSEANCRVNWMKHSANQAKCASPGSYN